MLDIRIFCDMKNSMCPLSLRFERKSNPLIIMAIGCHSLKGFSLLRLPWVGYIVSGVCFGLLEHDVIIHSICI